MFVISIVKVIYLKRNMAVGRSNRGWEKNYIKMFFFISFKIFMCNTKKKLKKIY